MGRQPDIEGHCAPPSNRAPDITCRFFVALVLLRRYLGGMPGCALADGPEDIALLATNPAERITKAPLFGRSSPFPRCQPAEHRPGSGPAGARLSRGVRQVTQMERFVPAVREPGKVPVAGAVRRPELPGVRLSMGTCR